MKAFLFLILSLSVFASQKMIWWNIGFNHYSLPSEKQGFTKLDLSILDMINADIDVIVLGEYRNNTLNSFVEKRLKEVFSYSRYIQYNNDGSNGFFIGAKNKFDLEIEDLDYVDDTLTSKEKKIRRQEYLNYIGSKTGFTRKYVRFSLKLDEKNYSIIPYHFNNPWTSLKRKNGKYKTGLEIMLGHQNPLVDQMKNFKSILRKDLGESYTTRNLIMLGDSNCPEDLYYVAPRCFRRLDNILPVISVDAGDFTFPAPNKHDLSNYPGMKIDHAQVSQSVKVYKHTILTSEGSDHFPLYLEFE